MDCCRLGGMKRLHTLKHLACLSVLGVAFSGLEAVEPTAPQASEHTESLQQTQTDPRDSLFKIFTVASRPNYQQPWSMQRPGHGTGSGALLDNGLIITNAHVIADGTFIQIRHNGSPQRHRVKVVAVDHDADLALLQPENPAILEGIPPLHIGELPEINSEVKVLGFPTGGDSLSTTRGVLSRVEHRRYAHSGAWLLAAQIDAAINPGNSGGPVLNDDKIVGIVMQGITNADNIGYMIPAPVVLRFIEDVENNKEVDGWPTLNISLQNLESPALRKYLQMPDNEYGQRIMKVQPHSVAKDILLENDVILSIDGSNLADDGSIELISGNSSGQRTNWQWAVQRHQIGSTISMKVLRNGEQVDVVVTLDQNRHDSRIVSPRQFDVKPDFYVFGGLIFTPLTTDYLRTMGNRAPRHLVNKVNDTPEDDQEIDEYVVLMRTLPHPVNLGWHGASNTIVESVNGQDIKNLKHLMSLIEQSEDEFIVLNVGAGGVITLERQAAINALAEIAQTYRLPTDRSASLK